MIVVVALCAASAAVAGRALGSEGPDGVSETRRHVVREGDTLWSIARRVVGPEGDPRPVVDDIRVLNAVDDPGALQPGVRLIVPATSP